jgi:hypothetical protein
MKRYVLVTLLFVALGFLVFRDFLFLYFHSDDFVWLLNAQTDSLGDLSKYFFDTQGFFYRPFTKLYFWQMWQLVTDNSYWYHFVNILIHTINSLLVLILASKVLHRSDYFKKKKQDIFGISFITSLLYFVHPIHLENIIWVSAVTELLPAMFLLLALICSFDYLSGDNVWWKRIVIFFGFVLGLFSHEYAVVFPAIVFATDWYLSSKSLIKLVFEKTSFYLTLAVITLIYLILRWFAGSHWSGGDYSYDLMKLPFNIAGNLLGYIGSGIFGIGFLPIYQNLREMLRSQLLLSTIILSFVAAALFIGWTKFRKSSQAKSLGSIGKLFVYLSLVFVILLLPFLGLGGIAERYLYLPSFAFLLSLSVGLYILARFLSDYSESVPVMPIFILSSLFLSSFYLLSVVNDTKDWKLASDYVESSLVEFKENCASFKEGELLVRPSPPNRIGRAWVYQVGYEEGANLYCPKSLKIQRI